MVIEEDDNFTGFDGDFYFGEAAINKKDDPVQ